MASSSAEFDAEMVTVRVRFVVPSLFPDAESVKLLKTPPSPPNKRAAYHAG